MGQPLIGAAAFAVVKQKAAMIKSFSLIIVPYFRVREL
jgi:hypothetical protein